MPPNDTTGQLAIDVPAQPKKRTRAELQSAIKSARDIMRKDAGLNGDLDRLPQLTWILFLRAFDVCVEEEREAETLGYERVIQPPYDWASWGVRTEFTGGEFLDFVNMKLLPYLRDLKSDEEGDPRNVISTIFQDVNNRMLSGTLLRDLVNVVNDINFDSADDIHTMAFVYESILKEMRDAAGDSGEFYTPRPVIRFMVEQSFLKLGESILDPACGTGGFLVEAYEELKELPRSQVELAELHHNIRGMEKKPLPYLLGMMNLLLHGVDAPNVIRTNALRRMRKESSPKHRVNVVLTNPPFGGEEEKSVAAAFDSAGVGTHETAWLFLYSVIERLKPGGRCAIVLPNSVLFGGGVGAKIKQKLMRECNLHTIVRLPQGVFAPYTPIAANVLFFEKAGSTKETWFYELPLPEGRRGYSKTKPMRYEEFAGCAEWWGGERRVERKQTDQAWKVSIAEVEANGYNLELSNPRAGDDLAHRAPLDVVGEILVGERHSLQEVEALHGELEELSTRNLADEETGNRICVGDFLELCRRPVDVHPEATYREIGIRSFGRGVIHKPPVTGEEIGAKRVFHIEPGDLLFSNIFAWEGAVALAGESERGYIGSHRFMTYRVDSEIADSGFLRFFFAIGPGLEVIRAASPGSAGRNRTLGIKAFAANTVWLPPLPEQKRISSQLNRIAQVAEATEARSQVLAALRISILNAAFTGQL